MSKVGEYYRELSELGINPRDIREAKKSVPLHDRRFYSGEERRKNSGIVRNKFTWGWQGGMANSGIKITEEEYRKNYRNGITEVYLMKKEKEADKKSKFFKEMTDKFTEKMGDIHGSDAYDPYYEDDDANLFELGIPIKSRKKPVKKKAEKKDDSTSKNN